MAAWDFAGSFQEEATCSVCLDYFTDPVTIDCGHNFCRTCISECWGGSEPNFCCPQCRETHQQQNLRPNRQLGNMVKLVKRLRLQVGKEPKGQRVCEKHQESLKLFCKEDEALICVVCDRSREHRAHTVVPLEEAAQDYKEQILSRLEHLREKREKLQGLKFAWEQESERFLRQTELERQWVMFECEGLRQLLAEHESLLLARLGELDEEIVMRREENVARLCEETARLRALIAELEGKCQQSAHELLQDVRSAVNRGEEVTSLHPAPEFLELEKRSWDFPSENKLQEALTGFLERLTLDRGYRRARAHAMDVTLDPDTAHPYLILSEDRKSVREGGTRQDVPDNPERFDTYVNVLGSERFKGGRHYWEVEVGDKRRWGLGVCRESVHRKGDIICKPGNGYWTLWLRDRGYKASASCRIPLSVRVRPMQVGVFLDYEAGKVSFYNVTDKSHLFTFNDTFSGTLCPYFSPCLNDGGTNAGPLTICPVSPSAGPDTHSMGHPFPALAQLSAPFLPPGVGQGPAEEQGKAVALP
ncbi:E3 ubiquitin-protein ligase TRIM39 isoform X1 [Alligator mississippiensis]|uniref:E3 ubiquitin-protein ligase TRIM39 isoform X1 n=1 Tax=Alligator mississippiensis TaxID=8496 RepID=UPI00071154BA|nr:E3 ubiquitin-protein ligase TRIM39 isoform X1 [Alligator mississippiensis]